MTSSASLRVGRYMFEANDMWEATFLGYLEARD